MGWMERGEDILISWEDGSNVLYDLPCLGSEGGLVSWPPVWVRAEL